METDYNLSLPQISGLATWSFGMVMTQSSSLSKVSTLIAKVNQEEENTVRQRLKQWYKLAEAKAKKGNKRASMCINYILLPVTFTTGIAVLILMRTAIPRLVFIDQAKQKYW